MRFVPFRSLAIPFALTILLACTSSNLGQTQRSESTANPCPTSDSTTAKPGPGKQSTKPSDKVRLEFVGLNAIPYCDALSLLRNAGEPLTADKMPDLKTIEGATAVLKEKLESLGYLK